MGNHSATIITLLKKIVSFEVCMKPTDWIALFIGTITLVVTSINLVQTLRYRRKEKYIEVITSQRIQWIGVLREKAVSVIDNLLYLQRNCLQIQLTANETDYSNEVKGKINELIRSIVSLSLMINPRDDKKLHKRLLSIIKQASKDPQGFAMDTFRIERTRFEIQLLLKREWEKVKNETEYGVKQKKAKV